MPNLRAWSGRLPTALFATLLAGSAPAAPAEIGGAVLTPVPFEALPGFPGPDPAAALEAFRRVCAAPTPPTPQPAGVAGDPAALSAACAAAADVAPEAADAFFRQRFEAFRVVRPGPSGLAS